MDFYALAQQCAPQVEVPISAAIVHVESDFNPLAIGVNRGAPVKPPARYEQAVAQAKNLRQQSANFDLGIAQINSKNLDWLNLTINEAFDPCRSLSAMQTVYLDCFKRASNKGLGTRMQRAFSCYNTGNFQRGFFNGYVNKVTRRFNQYVDGLNPNTYLTLPANSQDLADFATDLQTSITDTADAFQPVVTVMPPASILIEDNTQAAHAWDIFNDF